MKNLTACALLLGSLIVSVVSCQKQEIANDELIPEENYMIVASSTLCGYEQYDLMYGTRNSVFKVGEVEVANDDQNLYVDLTMIDTSFTQYKLFVGDCESRTGAPSSNPDLYENPLSGTFYADSALITIPLNTLEPCFCIVARVLTPAQGEPGNNDLVNIGGAAIIDYCQIPCPSCNTHNVFGMGGWGSKPAGNNPGSYLHANFNAWFPSGITLGCAGGYTLRLNTAQDVTNFLPQGGTPRSLSQSYVNPTNRISVLGGHLLTMVINAASNSSLGGQVITNGDFAGLTVDQFIAQANNFYGGCITGDANKYSSALASISGNPSHNVSCD